MKLNKYIFTLILSILFLGVTGERVYAQKPGSPETTFNALDYRFQKFDKSPVSFADSIKFRNKFYNLFSGGIFGEWETISTLDRPMTGLSGRFTVGYRVTPVHAIETDIIYQRQAGDNMYGLNLNYVMNLTNFMLRRDAHNKMEALYIAGLSYRYTPESSFGVNTGIRLQYNVGVNAGFFIEPKINIFAHPGGSRLVTTHPSVEVGFTLRYHQPEYYLWDYLTPFAIKTNLLYDAVSALNIGIEVPIRNRWSVAFEWLAPWWSSYENKKYFQFMNGTMEGRYWFGDRDKKLQLTGWFTGVSVGAGVYDFMYDPNKGIQGDMQSYSVIVGYAHPINKSGTFRLEYALALGWMRSEYVKYWWDGYDYSLYAPTPQTWVSNWFGPTKAEISLVYMLKLRSKVGGRP